MQHPDTSKSLISSPSAIDNSQEVFTGFKAAEPRKKLPGRTESMDPVPVPSNQSESSRVVDLQNPRKATETGEGDGNGAPARMHDTQALLNSAYQIAREAGRSHQEAKERSPALSDRPALPELARLLAVNSVISGVTEYADGVIKVVTESGNSYCMQTRSNLPEDGLVKPESIPMTCP